MASAASGNVAAVAAVSATAADSSNCSTFLETVQSRQCQQLTHCVTHVESACLALLTEFRQLTEERPAAETKHYRFIHDRLQTVLWMIPEELKLSPYCLPGIEKSVQTIIEYEVPVSLHGNVPNCQECISPDLPSASAVLYNNIDTSAVSRYESLSGGVEQNPGDKLTTDEVKQRISDAIEDREQYWKSRALNEIEAQRNSLEAEVRQSIERRYADTLSGISRRLSDAVADLDKEGGKRKIAEDEQARLQKELVKVKSELATGRVMIAQLNELAHEHATVICRYCRKNVGSRKPQFS
eukprot:Lankesteria_metandrocarpae@DN4097_c0_g1_i1.p1